jgi:uncharacterized RDD family membrane protein YckC
MSERQVAGRVPCPKCSGYNPEIAKFCNRCGAELSAAAAPAAAPAKNGVGRKICPGCHRFNAAAATYCADCGVGLPTEVSVPLFGGPAGFWHRALALVIDGILLSLIIYFLAVRLGLPEVDYERLPVKEALLRDLPNILLGTVVTSIYAMIMVGTWGGTAGKLLLGLRVVRHVDGGKVPYGLALGRSLAEFVSAVPLGLGYLWVALTPAKRAWHDYLCDTRVVRVRPE